MTAIRDLVIVGAGGFGREVLDVVAAMNDASPRPVFRVHGVVDDGPSEASLSRLADREIPWLGQIEEWITAGPDSVYLIGVGSPSGRRVIDQRMQSAGVEAAIAIHPTATIGSRSSVAPGGVICAGVQVSTNVRLGRHVHLNPNSTVGHDTTTGDYVSVNPGAIVSGDVTVSDGVLIGAGAVVLQGLVIGADAIVGAAACVTRDVADGASVKGVPAR